MYDKDHHFLDTNVIIGYTVEWDDHNHFSEKYFSEACENDCKLHTSVRVGEEARTVVEDCRRLILQAFELLSSDFKPREDRNLRRDMFNFLIDNFSDRERFSSLKKYLEYKFMDIRNLVLRGYTLDKVMGEVQDDFRLPLEFLHSMKNDENNDIHFFDNVPPKYSSVYPQKFSKLDSIMENKSDRDIAFDAFHLKREKDYPEIVLSSFDSDFVDGRFKPSIEGILTGLYIFNLLELGKS